MNWDYWLTLYLKTHCVARGLSTKTIGAYEATLDMFRSFLEVRLEKTNPAAVTACDALTYVEYLRSERNNGDSAVNRQVTVLKVFYRAMVGMGQMHADDNPLAHFPKMKGSSRKLPVVLTEEEIKKLLDAPPSDSVLGLRDRALLALLYGTGIRATECATLTEENVDLDERTIKVTGKGGHERTIPLNDRVVTAMHNYRIARGAAGKDGAFFRSRHGKALSRGAVYERVRKWSKQAKIKKHVSPHRIRHTFATHLVKKGVNLVTIRDLLGHRLITSTQIYLHVTGDDLRDAADRHPISKLSTTVEELLPDVKLPLQRVRPPGGQRAG